jgi:hypothetical protein
MLSFGIRRVASFWRAFLHSTQPLARLAAASEQSRNLSPAGEDP